ncbi:MAG: hypothetical protein PCFJNLEI_01522 [Verrucomicrobiae bacterium]|nr:hypothetical protein [Verrucomicrobiae bacterium]
MIRAVIAWLCLAATASAADVRLLVPLYSYPSWYNPATYLWDDVAQAARQVPVTAIINPNNGPNGGPPNSDYVAGLAELRTNGVTILGYVYTSYGGRDTNLVKADIDLYDQHYNIDGIFLDEVAAGTDKLTYYGQLYDYIKSRPHLRHVVTNPGTHMDEAYLSRPATDTSVIFENDTGWNTYVPSAYVSAYDSRRFAMLVYSVGTAGAMRSNIARAVHRNLAYVYVTNDGGANPWDSLPAYWPEEIAYVRSLRELRITGVELSGADAVVRFTSLSNHTFRVAATTNLTGGSWLTLTNALAGTGSIMEIVDPGGALPPRRFYRVELLP